MLDVVLATPGRLDRGTDVPGTVSFRRGGSAATTAAWLARLGARATLVAAVGRDPAGRTLVEAVRADRVVVRVVRVASARTGRIGVVVEAGGERSFVADRGAADLLHSGDVRPSWFRGVELVHLPAYSLISEPLAGAALRAIELGRAEGAIVSLDLASIGPLLTRGRRAAMQLVRGASPDLLFATATEAEGLLGGYRVEALLDLAPVAIVKRGAKGATVLAIETDDRLRFEVATQHLTVSDTTGAGDAFDAGFIVSWLGSRAAGRSLPAALQRAALAGHRAAARQLGAAPAERPIA
jgi:sugar/nucleoside kinase (ribokinase family)